MDSKSEIINQKSEIACARILGVDTSLRSTGLGLIQVRGSCLEVVEHGVVKNPSGCSLSRCLSRLHAAVGEILERGKPGAVAIEGIFFCKNVRTAVILGEARGVVIAACAAAGVPVYEYSPRRVKQAVVGFGGAGKEQVVRMVTSLLGLREAPSEDAADALAIAICHAHAGTSASLMGAKEI
ncbi:MAG: crossover junction endodeoxyribonuclease RuvC [Kiritimatiellae bacterium]|nr:crossover junction endodeoxyribonuclease RuvC [Kiritimatiellia bacterium]